jgi:acetyl/propionyl-CoA carboxylase alpha subunit
MRAVYDPNEFHELYDRAVDEAARSFGDGRMMVEKLIQRPRHVEVQLLADTHGHVSTLFERDCSVQRRRQKLIEEAPAPNADDLGPKLADEARRLAEHAGYTNAGTAEFIVDADSGDYYFLEVNARLQVEHPVTEQITGVDLVQAQIAVALGERVEFRLERANIRGWSIEARINGEDPNENFRPAVGRLHIVHWPRRPGVRIDAGFASGDEVTPHYDSLLAKIIAHAPTRDEAIRRLRSALEETVVLGPATNIGFLIRVLQDPRFTEGTFDTNLIEREGLADRNLGPPPPEIELLAGVATAAPSYGEVSRRPPSVWEAIDGFRNA